MLMGDDHACSIEGIGIVLIRIFNGMLRELTNVRCIPQSKKNLISVRAWKAQDLKGTFTDGVLKMLKGSMVVLKDVRQNILYYLKSSIVTI